jgi:hypothetical protein
MKRLILPGLIILLATSASYGQKNRKVSSEEKANMTAEQRIAMDNDRVKSKNKKGKKEDTVKKKVKRAKKQDKKNRKVRKPKKK